MSTEEQQQENGTTNGGDVPEIELIIKEEFIYTNDASQDEQIASLNNEHNVPQQLSTTFEDLIKNENIDTISPNHEYLKYECEPEKIQELSLLTSLRPDENVDNKILALSSKLEPNSNFVCANTTLLQSPIKIEVNTKLEPLEEQFCDDTTTQMDFASVVAEACEGLFDDIENELDLNLTVDDDSIVTKETDHNCECSIVNVLKRKEDSEAMQLAVAAVLHEGLSLGQAAKKYNVAKSTIWARVSKHPKHRRRKVNNELAEIIHTKLSVGESLSEISRSLNVAKSTVHQHKIRLTKHGKLPAISNKEAQLIASIGSVQDRLCQAYRAYRVNGMSVRFAAEFYSLPATTLWRYIKRSQTNKEIANVTKEDASTPDNSDNNIIATGLVKTEIQPEDQQLFEQTLLNHLFE